MKYLALWLCLMLFPFGIHAQNVSNCTTGKAEQFLDINNVRARILNTGGLFWSNYPNVYTVPKDGNVDAIFVYSFMLGGYDSQNRLHIAAANYDRWEFWPGPIAKDGEPIADCSPYDRLYRISKTDLQEYAKGQVPTKDLAEWPYDLGAPVVDGDGNPNNYNLQGGDRPELIGDQMVWWIMNDLGNTHKRTNSLPVGVEVRVTAFAFNTAALANTTFYRYKIKYRGKEPLSKMAMGFFADPVLGVSSDDLVGSDSTHSVAYVYNAKENDDSYDSFSDIHYGYGLAPPAMSFVVFKSPLATKDGKDNDFDGKIDEPNEQLGMTSFLNMIKGNICHTPASIGIEYYYALNGLCKNGSSIKMYGDGFPTNIGKTTKFHFNGNPITKEGWSAENYDGKGSRFTGYDRVFTLGIAPFSLEPEEEVEMAFGIVWARSHNRFASLAKSWRLAQALSKADNDLFTTDAKSWDYLFPEYAPTPEPFEVTPTPQNNPLQKSVILRQNVPNPASAEVSIPFWLPYPDEISLKIYDILGREVATLLTERREAGSHSVQFDTRTLPAGGVYLCTLTSKNFGLSATMRMSVFK